MLDKMNGYLFQKGKLDNTIHEIDDVIIVKLLAENERDRLECEETTRKTNAGEFQPNSMQEFWLDLLRDSQREGFIMRYPYGTVIRQAERNHYYRGENKVYLESVASLYRSMKLKNLNSEEKKMYKFISDMRIHQFGSMLQSFKHVNNWSKKHLDVLLEPLAQHYGFETTWLDITNDFLVAMFFATCKFDETEKRWKPLTKEQINVSKYGMIFHIPAWQINTKRMVESFSNAPDNAAWPIGFQPFMRCHMQSGYGINMRQEKPLQDDVCFEKLKFKHSEKLSAMIYDMTDQGRKIFPHEGILAIEDVIKEIRETAHFSDKDFNYAFKKNDYSNEDAYRVKLLQSNLLKKQITISSDMGYKLSKEQIKIVNIIYKDFSIEKDYGVKLGTRLVYYPEDK